MFSSIPKHNCQWSSISSHRIAEIYYSFLLMIDKRTWHCGCDDNCLRAHMIKCNYRLILPGIIPRQRWRRPSWPWWRHGMETLSVSLALCEGDPPVTRWIPLPKSSNAELSCFFVDSFKMALRVAGGLQRLDVHGMSLEYDNLRTFSLNKEIRILQNCCCLVIYGVLWTMNRHWFW